MTKYYLNNKQWMLDSAGEWYYDEATYRAYLKPITGAPDDRVDASYQIYGIYAYERSYITIDGLSIRRVFRGIELGKARGFAIRNTDVMDTEDTAIVSIGGSDAVIENNTISNSGRGGIWIEDSDSIFVLNKMYKGYQW